MTPLAEAVRDALVPPRCAGCGRPGAWFCIACRDACEPSRARLPAGPALVACGAHEGPLRAAIHALKYREERALSCELGALVASRVAADLAVGIRLDVVAPVPLHPARRRMRGYDQAALLAEVVGEATGLPVREALRRIRHSRPQVELDRAHRAASVRGAFVTEAGALRGLRVALVDDVATTGATLAEAART
ncbi:MAG: ComF family protein, partial [Candidatus Limnocylindria bacterium]